MIIKKEKKLIIADYIPLDKSWLIRMGILDLIHGYNDTVIFLERQKDLSDDLQALYRVLLDWKTDKPIDVGESGTLYRLLKFTSWKLGLKKQFILRGTLKERKICDNPEIVNLSLTELLKIDNGTSQWATASLLLGNKEAIKNPPYKLKLTYEAIKHWNKQRRKKLSWKPRYDETILNQAKIFLKLLKKEKAGFIPQQAEDYCFARAFNYLTKEKGEKLWLSLHGHETDRIEEMEKALDDADNGREISSRDHRVVQAVAMRAKIKGQNIKLKYPTVVNKSWPQFWKFFENALE